MCIKQICTYIYAYRDTCVYMGFVVQIYLYVYINTHMYMCIKQIYTYIYAYIDTLVYMGFVVGIVRH